MAKRPAKTPKHFRTRAHGGYGAGYGSDEEVYDSDVSIDRISAPSGSEFPGVDIENFRRSEVLTPLKDEQLMLACPCVKGFDLKSKEWCEFSRHRSHLNP